MNSKLQNYSEIVSALEREQDAYLFTSVLEIGDLKIGDKFVVTLKKKILFSDNAEFSSKNSEIFEKTHEFEPEFKGVIEIDFNGGVYLFFVERFAPPNRIFIFGAGHVAEKLCCLLQHFTYSVTVFDDRADLLKKIEAPNISAEQIDFDNLKLNINFCERDYIVIVTRGHSYDKEVLKKVIASSAKYIGMIGSRKRVAAVKTLLISEGINEELFSKVSSPIGLPISGAAVEEIALAILAEITAVKNDKTEILKSCQRY